MRKLLFASVLLLALPAAAQPSKPSFEGAVEVNVVNVDVAVTDRQGNRVTGLKKEDFEVLEDGKRVEVVNFDALEGGAGGLTGDGAPRDPEEAWTLAIFFDDANIQPSHRARVLQQLHDFLAHKTAPGDRVMLATNDLSLHIRVPFTSDLAALDRGFQEISALPARGAESERDRTHAVDSIVQRIQVAQAGSSDLVPCPLDIATPAQTYAGARRQEVLRSLGALKVLVNSLSGMPGRKAVLHVSDGIPMTPGEEVFQFLAELCKDGTAIDLEGGESPTPRQARSVLVVERPPVNNPRGTIENSGSIPDQASYQGGSQALLDAQTYSVAKELEALAAHANANRVTLYALQASGVQGNAATQAGSGPGARLFRFPSVSSVLRAGLRDSLQLLADETGGRAILDANDFGPGLSRMRDDFSTVYSLGISPAHNGDSREHKLAVKVKRPGLELRYRQSYRDKPALERAVDRTLAALYHGIEENPLDVTLELGDQAPAAGGQYSVPLRLRIPLFKLTILNQNDTYQGSLRLMVVIRDEQGETSGVRQVEVPLNIPRKEVLNAMGQYYVYTLTLKMNPGLQHVAIAVRDDLGVTTSYLSRTVTAGGVAAASGH
jgi:VWFA-related protein